MVSGYIPKTLPYIAVFINIGVWDTIECPRDIPKFLRYNDFFGFKFRGNFRDIPKSFQYMAFTKISGYGISQEYTPTQPLLSFITILWYMETSPTLPYDLRDKPLRQTLHNVHISLFSSAGDTGRPTQPCRPQVLPSGTCDRSKGKISDHIRHE